jgi:hypothetical protein
MQEHSFIPELGIKIEDFWHEARHECAPKHDMDEVLAYMQLMLTKAEPSGGITKTMLEKHAHDLTFFKGVESWFSRINDYARNLGIEVQHYIISSGLREMIKATTIGDEFEYIWASGFMYDDSGKAIWPALAVNYTTKTQYLFRINKGVMNSYNNEEINSFMPDHKRAVPFSNIIYIGDGDTDVPSMKMMKHQGGNSIAVYDPAQSTKKQPACKNLQLQGRINYYAEANYTEDSELDNVIKDIITHTAVHY